MKKSLTHFFFISYFFICNFQVAVPDAALRQFPPTAATNGTSRVQMRGPNIGRVTRIIFLNSQLPTGMVSAFTNCTGDVGFVECTAPPGLGAVDAATPPGSLVPLLCFDSDVLLVGHRTNCGYGYIGKHMAGGLMAVTKVGVATAVRARYCGWKEGERETKFQHGGKQFFQTTETWQA